MTTVYDIVAKGVTSEGFSTNTMYPLVKIYPNQSKKNPFYLEAFSTYQELIWNSQDNMIRFVAFSHITSATKKGKRRISRDNKMKHDTRLSTIYS